MKNLNFYLGIFEKNENTRIFEFLFMDFRKKIMISRQFRLRRSKTNPTLNQYGLFPGFFLKPKLLPSQRTQPRSTGNKGNRGDSGGPGIGEIRAGLWEIRDQAGGGGRKTPEMKQFYCIT